MFFKYKDIKQLTVICRKTSTKQNMLDFQRGVTSVIVASSKEQAKDMLVGSPGSSLWAGFDPGPFLNRNPGGEGTSRAMELVVSIW